MIEKLTFFINVVIYFMNFSCIVLLLFVSFGESTFSEKESKVIETWRKKPIKKIIFSISSLEDDYSTNDEHMPAIFEWCKCKTKIISGACDNINNTNETCTQINFNDTVFNDLDEFYVHLFGDEYLDSYSRHFVYTYDNEFNYTKNYFLNVTDKKKEGEECVVIDSVGNYYCQAKSKEGKIPFYLNYENNRISNTEEDIFSNNFNIDPIINYGKLYIGWKKKCEKIFTEVTQMDALSFQLQLLATAYPFLGIFLLFYCLFFIILVKEIFHQGIYSDLFLILVHIALLGWITWLISYDVYRVKTTGKMITKVLEKQCTDAETLMIFSGVSKELSSMEYFYFLSILLIILMISLSFFKIILLVYKAYKRKIISSVLQDRVIDNISLEVEMLLI